MANLFFPKKTIEKMAKLLIKEDDIHDVFTNGEHRLTTSGATSASRKYSSQGYEIGVYYAKSKYNNEYIITHVWKRDRR